MSKAQPKENITIAKWVACEIPIFILFYLVTYLLHV